MIRRFFALQLPVMLDDAKSTMRSGTISFEIPDVGAWIVSIASSACTVVPTDVPTTADLSVYLRADVFEDLLEGHTSTPGRGFTALGDAALLDELLRVLRGRAKGIIDLRSRR